MSFIDPMLAAPMSVTRTTRKPVDIFDGNWVAEEKFDGHRLIVEVRDGRITAWSRDALKRVLPPHLEELKNILPTGIYDGELIVPGGKCHDVTELTELSKLVFVAFDYLQDHNGVSLMDLAYIVRRQKLENLHGKGFSYHDGPARLSGIFKFTDKESLYSLAQEIWNRGGEGLIIKNIYSEYYPAKRPKTGWVKLKKQESAVLTIIGFEASRGKIIDRGRFAAVILRDDEGNVTTVKTKNNVELAKFEAQAPKQDPNEFSLSSGQENHPAIGRKLRIEFQERTADGSYREPRWDRWEEE